jgi:hypothetical protein
VRGDPPGSSIDGFTMHSIGVLSKGKDMTKAGHLGKGRVANDISIQKALKTSQISDPLVHFWDTDLGHPEGASLIWTVPAMLKIKENGFKIEGVAY